MGRQRMLAVTLFASLFFFLASTSSASDEDLRKELELLKQKVAQLEEKLEQSQKDSQQEGKREVKEGRDPMLPKLGEVKEEIEDKIGGLEFHGGAVGFVNGMGSSTIGKKKVDDAIDAGIVGDFELTYRPGLPLFKNGKFFFRVHAGEGRGIDRKLEGRLFANINTIADDSASLEDDDDEVIKLLEAYYAHEFFDGKLLFAIGKTEPLVFIDDNTFANDEYIQFVGKPFVNNPILSDEDDYGPIAAVSYSPVETLTVTALGASSGRPFAEENSQKNIYNNIFDQALVAGQVMFSPKLGELQGNYRVYAWDATYPHPAFKRGADRDGWGIGLSLDQQVTEQVGLFGRFGYQNEDVYDAPWFWSAGAAMKGLIAIRGEDVLGIGVAGLKANDELAHNGTEIHTELYYRIFLTENFAITPDFQYVANPLGNSDNDGIFSGLLRGQWSF